MADTLKSDSIDYKLLHEYMEFLEEEQQSMRDHNRDLVLYRQDNLAKIIHSDRSEREIEAIHDEFQERYHESVEELEKLDAWRKKNEWTLEFQQKQNYWLKCLTKYTDLTTAAAYALGYGPGPYRRKDREKLNKTYRNPYNTAMEL